MSLPNPIVILDARSRYAHPGIACSRPSIKRLFGSTGKRQVLPPNTLPWECNPVTGEALGLRVEGQATNAFESSGVEDWTRSSVAAFVSGLDGPNAGRAWRRVEAVAGGFDTRSVRSQVTTVEGSYYALSFDVRPDQARHMIIAIQNTNERSRIKLNLETGDAAVIEGHTVDHNIMPIYEGWRVTIVFEAMDPAYWIYLYLKDNYLDLLPSNFSEGDGLFVESFQVEPSIIPSEYGFSTSPILTSTGAELRSADSIHVDLSEGTELGDDQGTVIAEAIPFAAADSPAWALREPDGSAGVGIGVRSQSKGSNWRALARGPSDPSPEGAVVGGGGLLKTARTAMSYDLRKGVFRLSVNGAAPRSFEHSYSEGASQLWLGRYRMSGAGLADVRFNGWIRRLYYYPVAMTPMQLQSLTAIQE